MWVMEEFAKATVSTREREAEQARLVSEARRTQQDGAARSWRWSIEPGMDGAFRNLLGWLLSSQRDASVESASTVQGREDSAASAAAEPIVSTARDAGPARYCCLPGSFPLGCCAQVQ